MRCSAESEETECLPLHGFLGCAAAFFLKIFLFSGAFAKYLENKSVQILRKIYLQNCMRHMIQLLEFLRHIFHSLYGRQSAVQKESVSINMIQMEMQQMPIID